VEGYRKWLFNLFVSEWTPFPRLTTQLQPADGQAAGVDLHVEVRRPGFYGTLTYGLASVRYEMVQPSLAIWFGSERMAFRLPQDRRHQLNVLAGTRLAGFDVQVQWNVGSGSPYSRPVGFDAFLLVDKNADVFETDDRERVIYAEPFNARLPTYPRLDVSVERSWAWQGVTLALQAGVINVYDRPNIFAFDTFIVHTPRHPDFSRDPEKVCQPVLDPRVREDDYAKSGEVALAAASIDA
jgi:hypothetical protein